MKIARTGSSEAERPAIGTVDTHSVFVDDVVPSLSRHTLIAGALGTLAHLKISSRGSVDRSEEGFGAPRGVGFGIEPPKYLAAGGTIETGIARLGVQRASTVAS